ncbi:MAG: hypothetical protein ABSC55_19440 [Syntrophorhabdales bacterium]
MAATIFITTHLIPFATDHGVSAATASNMLAWFGLAGLAGILIAGPVADLIGVKIPIILTFALRVVIFLLILRRTDVTSIYTFALAAGFTVLITAPLSPSSAVMVKFSEKWATFFRKAEQHQHPFSENRM